MKIVSFNVNGIRARFHQISHLIEQYAPDIIGLQETKVDDPEFPVEFVQNLGYQVHFFGQKGHYGVAILSKVEPLEVIKGFSGDDESDQKRLITAKFATDKGVLTVINGYFPQGESRHHETKFPAKQKFYDDLSNWLEADFASDQDTLVVMGDLNISPEDIDIGIGEQNAKRWLKTGKCSFLPEEREWLNRLKDWGLKDCFRHKYPDSAIYSWYDYRSKGFEDDPQRGLRIDIILATSSAIEQLEDAGIIKEMRGMEKPSDHCPVWSDFNFAFSSL
jgi:exodeoxyribonuclease-3